MSEDEKANVVSMEEHNKIVGAANTAKAEVEELKKTTEELKKNLEEAKKMNQEQTEKSKWEEELKKKDAQIEELKNRQEVKTEKVAKGIVQAQEPEQPKLDPKEELNKILPEPKVDPDKFGSAISRLAYFKNPATRNYNDEQIGMMFDLHGSAQMNNPQIVASAKNTPKANLIFNKT